MEKSTRKLGDPQPVLATSSDDALTAHLRARVSDWLQALITAELEAAIGAARYAHGVTERRGYRHAGRDRTVTTSLGPTTVTVPRGRLFTASEGPMVEWQSTVLPRYARRTRAVDESILGVYLAGANTRRVRGALQPLLGAGPLSRSAVSRVMQKLRAQCEAWRTRALAETRVVYLLLDAIHVRVRVDRRVQVVPVLVALGVDEEGHKELLALHLTTTESTAAWTGLIEDLASRGLPAPVLCIIDGNAGLRRAIATTWPRAHVQRCIVHKLRNLEAHAPKRALDALRADFHAITEASSLRAAKEAYRRFVRRWQPRSDAVVRSLEEAGAELLTFYAFPASQWRSLRSTNIIERVNQEFRRRVKTQAAQPSDTSVVRLLFALYVGGHIRVRRLNGWQEIPKVLARFAPERLTAAA
jgi:transposase-like protein